MAVEFNRYKNAIGDYSHHPHIILEGVNCVGKTKLKEMLLGLPEFCHYKEFYEREVRDTYHGSPNAQVALNAQLITMQKFIEITNERFIFDRLHFSEYVYGLVDRGYDAKDMFKKGGLDEKLSKTCKVIYLVREKKGIIDELNNRGIFEVDSQRISKLQLSFVDTLNSTKIQTLMVDMKDVFENKREISRIAQFILGEGEFASEF